MEPGSTKNFCLVKLYTFNRSPRNGEKEKHEIGDQSGPENSSLVCCARAAVL